MKFRGNERVILAISSMISCLTDLSNLASDHGIELSLYQDSVIDKILLLIGDHRRKRFLSETLGSNLSGVEKWNKIISLLNNEMRLCEAETLFDKSTQNFGLRPAVSTRAPNFSEGNPRRTNSPRDSYFDNDAKFSERNSRKYDSSRNPKFDGGHKSAFNASNVPKGFSV